VETIKPGDDVVLKSGGPKMAVQEMVRNPKTGVEEAECLWFVNRQPKYGKFALNLLRVVEAPKQQ
jgi:uncharacterized protein YodC (DUF2158 family)